MSRRQPAPQALIRASFGPPGAMGNSGTHRLLLNPGSPPKRALTFRDVPTDIVVTLNTGPAETLPLRDPDSIIAERNGKAGTETNAAPAACQKGLDGSSSGNPTFSITAR